VDARDKRGHDDSIKYPFRPSMAGLRPAAKDKDRKGGTATEEQDRLGHRHRRHRRHWRRQARSASIPWWCFSTRWWCSAFKFSAAWLWLDRTLHR